MKTLAGALAGIVSGMIATVVYPGPLDLPAVGIPLACAIVAAGAWFMWEWGKALPWASYAVAVVAVTCWLTFFPPSDDALVAASAEMTRAWVVFSALACVVPPMVIRYLERTREGLPDLES